MIVTKNLKKIPPSFFPETGKNERGDRDERAEVNLELVNKLCADG
jgi:hypothetical protein